MAFRFGFCLPGSMATSRQKVCAVQTGLHLSSLSFGLSLRRLSFPLREEGQAFAVRRARLPLPSAHSLGQWCFHPSCSSEPRRFPRWTFRAPSRQSLDVLRFVLRRGKRYPGTRCWWMDVFHRRGSWITVSYSGDLRRRRGPCSGWLYRIHLRSLLLRPT